MTSPMETERQASMVAIATGAVAAPMQQQAEAGHGQSTAKPVGTVTRTVSGGRSRGASAVERPVIRPWGSHGQAGRQRAAALDRLEEDREQEHRGPGDDGGRRAQRHGQRGPRRRASDRSRAGCSRAPRPGDVSGSQGERPRPAGPAWRARPSRRRALAGAEQQRGQARGEQDQARQVEPGPAACGPARARAGRTGPRRAASAPIGTLTRKMPRQPRRRRSARRRRSGRAPGRGTA